MEVFDEERIGSFPIGNIPLHEHHLSMGGGYRIHPNAWITPSDLARLVKQGTGALVDPKGTPLAWFGASPTIDPVLEATDSFMIEHPWDLLRANETWVGALSSDIIHGEVHPHAVIEGSLQLGKGSRLLPGVYIEGKVVIGEGCKIGPNCYIRGNTSIGDQCHIGQSVEIKNSLILSKTNVGHLSYVGDSVIGSGTNLGAGTITSNFRHDGGHHRSMADGQLVDTGRRKFGAILGDGVHTGIHTSIYPGRKLYSGTSTLPGAIVREDLH